MAATQIEVKLNFIDGSLTSLELAVLNKGITASFSFVPQSLLNLLSQYAQATSSTKLTEEEDNDHVIKSTSETVETKKEKVRVWNRSYEKEFLEFVETISNGLEHHPPELCEEGVNGTYFLKDKEGNHSGVFKPHDEELSSDNNPKKNELDENKVFPLLPGEAAQREVAAYLLDRERFFGVPPTTLAHITLPDGREKYGSLQQFVDNNGASWDMGPSVFPDNEVHKIGILDLYTLNMDRHGGNILVKERENGSYSLIPIDNGFSLPDTFNIPNLWFEWMTWPQAKRPFDKKTLEFIDKLDVDQDIKMLRQANLGIREECLEIMRITGHLLKKCAAAGLTLYQIGSLLCPLDDQQSPLQRLLSSQEPQENSSTKTIHVPDYLNKLESLIFSA